MAPGLRVGPCSPPCTVANLEPFPVDPGPPGGKPTHFLSGRQEREGSRGVKDPYTPFVSSTARLAESHVTDGLVTRWVPPERERRKQ